MQLITIFSRVILAIFTARGLVVTSLLDLSRGGFRKRTRLREGGRKGLGLSCILKPTFAPN